MRILTSTLGILMVAWSPLSALAGVASSIPMELRRSLQREGTVLMDMLQGYHYSDRSFADIDTKQVIQRYLEAMDHGRLQFLSADKDFLCRRFERNLKSVYIFRGDFNPAYEIHDLFVERSRSRIRWLDTKLGEPLSFEPVMTAPPPEASESWAANAAEMDLRWEMLLRRETLELLELGYSEAESRRRVLRRHKVAMQTIQSWDALQVRECFLNSMLVSFDAHSGYFSRDTGEAFQQEMNGSVVGPGIQVNLVGGRLRVSHLMAGGAADLEGGIQPYDTIEWIEDSGGPRRDTRGWNERRAFRELGGAEGSRLRLGVRRSGTGETRPLELTRTRVETLHGHAEASLVEVPGGSRLHKVGLITVPTFYANPDASGKPASTSGDLRKLIALLASEGAQSLVIDLRNNGGGLLSEAVNCAGLFLPPGSPVTMMRGADRQISIQNTGTTEPPCWAGPLVILVSNGSASASEAFAGAMKFHRRALIVGSESTFGKGSAQNYIDLRTLPGLEAAGLKAEWGVLRVTRQLFYLPDGSSPQLEGVRSHIVLPTYWRDIAKREKDMTNALPNEKAPAGNALPSSSAPITDDVAESLGKLSAQRQAQMPEFRLARESTELRVQLRDRNGVRLEPGEWIQACRELHDRRRSLRKEWSKLMETEAFAQRILRLESVEATRKAHLQALATVKLADGLPRRGRLCGGVFIHPSEKNGESVEIPGSYFDFEYIAGDPAPLLEAWNATAPSPLDAAGLQTLLQRLNRHFKDPEEFLDDEAPLTELSSNAPPSPELRRALNALLEAVLVADGDLGRDPPRLDVRLREALRISVDLHKLRASDQTVSGK